MKLLSQRPIKLPSAPRMPSAPRIGDRRPLAAGALIVWIAISPWLWGFAGARPAIANHVFLVLGFGPIAVLIVALRPAAFVTVAGGVWLALSPWILGYAGNHAAWVNELITGALLAILGLSAARADALQRRAPRPRRARRRLLYFIL